MPHTALSLPRRTGLVGSLLIGAFAAVACGSDVGPSVSLSVPSRTSSTASSAPSKPGSTLQASTASSASPLVDAPFAFPADAVIAFYEGEGLTCGVPFPSTKAANWTVRTCEGTDVAGRPIAVGVVTDQAGKLGDGFASVAALPGEDVLEPTDALDMLSGFLGAMLGDAAATDRLQWLAGHLGDEYAEMDFGGGTIATYTESADDPTRIYVEIAGPSYLAAPAP
jgi:hypothetical protein